MSREKGEECDRPSTLSHPESTHSPDCTCVDLGPMDDLPSLRAVARRARNYRVARILSLEFQICYLLSTFFPIPVQRLFRYSVLFFDRVCLFISVVVFELFHPANLAKKSRSLHGRDGKIGCEENEPVEQNSCQSSQGSAVSGFQDILEEGPDQQERQVNMDLRGSIKDFGTRQEETSRESIHAVDTSINNEESSISSPLPGEELQRRSTVWFDAESKEEAIRDEPEASRPGQQGAINTPGYSAGDSDSDSLIAQMDPSTNENTSYPDLKSYQRRLQHRAATVPRADAEVSSAHPQLFEPANQDQPKVPTNSPASTTYNTNASTPNSTGPIVSDYVTPFARSSLPDVYAALIDRPGQSIHQELSGHGTAPTDTRSNSDATSSSPTNSGHQQSQRDGQAKLATQDPKTQLDSAPYQTCLQPQAKEAHEKVLPNHPYSSRPSHRRSFSPLRPSPPSKPRSLHAPSSHSTRAGQVDLHCTPIKAHLVPTPSSSSTFAPSYTIPERGTFVPVSPSVSLDGSHSVVGGRPLITRRSTSLSLSAKTPYESTFAPLNTDPPKLRMSIEGMNSTVGKPLTLGNRALAHSEPRQNSALRNSICAGDGTETTSRHATPDSQDSKSSKNSLPPVELGVYHLWETHLPSSPGFPEPSHDGQSEKLLASVSEKTTASPRGRVLMRMATRKSHGGSAARDWSVSKSPGYDPFGKSPVAGVKIVAGGPDAIRGKHRHWFSGKCEACKCRDKRDGDD